MRKMKKFLCAVLTTTMVLAMAAPSFAANGTSGTQTGTITITNPIDDQTYTAYKIFELESYSYNGDIRPDPNNGAYSYKVVGNVSDKTSWNYFVTEGAGKNYVVVDEQGYVSWKEEADAKAFAEAALTFAKDMKIEGISATILEDGGVGFENLALGYYLVDSSVGALCSLDTTDNSVVIREKNTAPAIDKKVDNADSTTASVGDSVPFTVTITAQPGAENYVFHDKMSNGLTFTETELNALTVTVDGNNVDANAYTKRLGGTETTPDTTCTFEIEFTKAYLDTITAATEIVISYHATLNENALVDENNDGVADGANNTAKLKYGDDNEVEAGTTPGTGVKVYTYEFDLVKTDADHVILPGAQFELYDAETSGNKIALVGNPSEGYRPATPEEKAVDGFESAVIEAGNVIIKGLGNGTYWLDETAAPAGYNKLAAREDVTINDGNVKATLNNNTWLDGGLHVVNMTGTMLPSTGGIGTTIFYAAGIILMAGAVFFVVRRKKA